MIDSVAPVSTSMLRMEIVHGVFWRARVLISLNIMGGLCIGFLWLWLLRWLGLLFGLLVANRCNVSLLVAEMTFCFLEMTVESSSESRGCCHFSLVIPQTRQFLKIGLRMADSGVKMKWLDNL